MSQIAVPEVELPVTDGRTVRPRDFQGKRTVLYFYPKDDTPGCTIEGREFTELQAEFRKKGVEVFGVSPDSLTSHERFIQKCELGVPLIADTDRALCEAFGVWKEKSMYGKTYMGVERSTFLIGPEGSVEREWRDVKAPGHAREVLDSLG